MAIEHPRLKLGKRASFVKTHLKQLPREKETWEVDFRALPKPADQTETHYLGLVVRAIALRNQYTEGVRARAVFWLPV